MKPLRKLMICPWFGALPPWFDRWVSNVENLKSQGYDFLLTTNLDLFNARCEKLLGFKTPIVPGEGKLHDYRMAFGVLFSEELRGYDFWGHTDFDCVYGDVAKFLPDEQLSGLDIYTDHTYICGPWTLYRNVPAVNQAFHDDPTWVDSLKNPKSTGWGEESFSKVLDAKQTVGKLRLQHGSMHRYTVEDYSKLRMRDGRLFVGDDEIMMFHFRRIKEYPAL